MPSTSLESFCDAWLAAWTGNRPDALLACYTGDARYLDPAFPGGLRGHAQLRAYFEKLLARNPDWVWKREELMPTAGGFTLKWRARLPDGADFCGLDIVELRDGLISRNEVYFDPAPLRAAAAATR